MKPHEKRRLEEFRDLSDIHDHETKQWVEEQLDHPILAIATAAQKTLNEDMAVWEFVDLFSEEVRPLEGVEALMKFVNSLPPDQLHELRTSAGLTAESLTKRFDEISASVQAKGQQLAEEFGTGRLLSASEINAQFDIDLEEEFGFPSLRKAVQHLDDYPNASPTENER